MALGLTRMKPTTVSAPIGMRSTAGVVALVALSSALIMCIVFTDDLRHIARTWANSETYAHGALVAPISAWLAWRVRARLAAARVVPWVLGYVGLAGFGVVWTLGTLAGVGEFREFGVVGMFVSTIIAICGRDVARVIAFPLGFLFLMVPFGDFLLPWMMTATADVTVWAVRALGIPVYQEGLQFVLASGRWSVVEACSGLRYLIASVVLGLLYAHLRFRSIGRKLAVVGLSLALPIVGNWVRAIGIVLLGHASDMSLATGVDHLVYGWLFFGVVMFAMFAIASRWSDTPAPVSEQTTEARAAPVRAAHVIAAGAVALLVPLLSVAVAQGTPGSGTVAPRDAALESALPGLRAMDRPFDYRPAFQGGQRETIGILPGVGDVGVYLAYYIDQRDGVEMVRHDHGVVAPEDPDWQVLSHSRSLVSTSIGPVPVNRYELIGRSGRRMLVQQWYVVDRLPVAGRMQAKLLTMRGVIAGRGDQSWVASVWSPIDGDASDGEKTRRHAVMESTVARLASIVDAQP